MDTITVIGIIIGSVGTILTGSWFMTKKSFEAGKFAKHFESNFASIEKNFASIEKNFASIEKSINRLEESINRLEESVQKQGESIQKIPLIELRLTSIEESVQKQGESVQKLEENVAKIPLIELRLASIEKSIQKQEEISEKQEESIKKIPLIELNLISIEKSIQKQEEISETQEKSIKEVIKNQEESIKNLPCAKHEKEYNSIKITLDAFKVLFETLKDATTTIAAWVMKQDNNMIGPLSGKISPRALTEAGKGLLEMSYGQVIIDSNLDFFINKIKELNPKTAYDVEELSMRVLISNTGESIFNCIKDFIYYAPGEIEIAGYKIKIELNAVILVMSLYLRDKYLKKYPFAKLVEPPNVEVSEILA